MILGVVRLVVAIGAVAVFAWATVESSSFMAVGRWFPWSISVAGLALATVNLVFEVWRFVRLRKKAAALGDGEAVPSGRRAVLDTMGAESGEEFVAAARWFVVVLVFPLTMYLVGAVVGAALWVGGFMLFAVRRGVLFSAISALAVAAMLILYSNYFNLRLPGGAVLFT